MLCTADKIHRPAPIVTDRDWSDLARQNFSRTWYGPIRYRFQRCRSCLREESLLGGCCNQSIRLGVPEAPMCALFDDDSARNNAESRANSGQTNFRILHDQEVRRSISSNCAYHRGVAGIDDPFRGSNLAAFQLISFCAILAGEIASPEFARSGASSSPSQARQ